MTDLDTRAERLTGYIYRAIFEIDDIHATVSELVALATPEVAVMAAGDGARLVGDLAWKVAGDRLVCEAPAEAVHHDVPEIDMIAVERACAGDPVRLNKREVIAAIAKLERQGLSAYEISRRLRRSYRTVQTYRTDIDDRARGTSRETYIGAGSR